MISLPSNFPSYNSIPKLKSKNLGGSSSRSLDTTYNSIAKNFVVLIAPCPNPNSVRILSLSIST